MEIKIIRRKKKDGDQDYQEEREGWRSRLSGGRKSMEIKIIRKMEKDVDQDYEGKREYGSRLRKTKKIWRDKGTLRRRMFIN